MGAEQKQEGVLIQRIRVFDIFGGDGVAHRDALVIADIYRGGQKAGAFVGVLGSFQVLSSASGRVGREGYLTLKDKAEEFLQQGGREREVIDSPMEWFNLPSILTDAAFVGAWAEEGHEHRWPSGAVPPPPPWRLNATVERVDYLDLLRFFFVRYLSGLPVRYRWSKTKAKWFQTAVDREEVWRLWPEAPSRRHQG